MRINYIVRERGASFFVKNKDFITYMIKGLKNYKRKTTFWCTGNRDLKVFNVLLDFSHIYFFKGKWIRFIETRQCTFIR